MITKIIAYFGKQGRIFITSTGLFLIVIIGILDLLTQYQISLSLLYLGPISLVAWHLGRTYGIFLAIVGAFVWFLAYVAEGPAFQNPFATFCNGLLILGEFLVVGFVVSELKYTHTSLRVSRERLELAMAGADLGMWDWNVQTGSLVFNQRWAEMRGLSPHEIRPHVTSWEEWIHPEDAERVKKILNRHISGDTAFYEVEYRIPTKTGEVRWLLARGKVVEWDDDGKPLRVAGTELDVTDRKRAEEELRDRTEDLERSNRDLEQFAYVAAHDLREPLVAVTAYLKLLERRCKGNLDGEGHKFLSRSIETTLRMDAVIQGLLAYSRIGRENRSLEPIDCEAVLKNALSNLNSAIEESGAKVTSEPLPTVTADAPQMLQLFQNLLSNAIKFRGDEPLRIHVGCTRGDGEFQFSVKDNGIGIEPPYIDRIFRMFERIDRGSDRPGTGIGLANCKKIVERHGGRMLVESEPGVGSTFFFTIPDRPGTS